MANTRPLQEGRDFVAEEVDLSSSATSTVENLNALESRQRLTSSPRTVYITPREKQHQGSEESDREALPVTTGFAMDIAAGDEAMEDLVAYGRRHRERGRSQFRQQERDRYRRRNAITPPATLPSRRYVPYKAPTWKEIFLEVMKFLWEYLAKLWRTLSGGLSRQRDIGSARSPV